jgi:hypothetical protein
MWTSDEIVDADRLGDADALVVFDVVDVQVALEEAGVFIVDLGDPHLGRFALLDPGEVLRTDAVDLGRLVPPPCDLGLREPLHERRQVSLRKGSEPDGRNRHHVHSGTARARHVERPTSHRQPASNPQVTFGRMPSSDCTSAS